MSTARSELGAQRLEDKAFSSALSIADFAACLHMGLRPVALVQGFCVMGMSPYAASPFSQSGGMAGAMGGGIGQAMFGQPMRFGQSMGSRRSIGTTIDTYTCPHNFGGMVPDEHRYWGENFEQPWVTQAWVDGFNLAYSRMVGEADEAGAHAVIGVVDRDMRMEGNVWEFHMTGTAVVVEGGRRPPDIWTTYLAGERLAKLIEAGFAPIAVVAGTSNVRIWEVCETEILERGGIDMLGAVQPGSEIQQLSDAHMAARRRARDHVRTLLGSDALHGARMDFREYEVGEGDREMICTLRGTRVRQVRQADPLPAPVPTVRLS